MEKSSTAHSISAKKCFQSKEKEPIHEQVLLWEFWTDSLCIPVAKTPFFDVTALMEAPGKCNAGCHYKAFWAPTGIRFVTRLE